MVVGAPAESDSCFEVARRDLVLRRLELSERENPDVIEMVDPI